MTARQFARAAGLAGLVFVAGTAAVTAQESAVQRGNAKFQHTCAPCHGPGPGDDGRAMLPGTAALQIKYQGSLPPLLEQRTDLTAAVLKTFLRLGSWSMPPFRPTELTDAEIEAIAAYLAESSKSAASTSQRR
jgi:mono/diheme cytochrome c family protein